MAVLSVIALGVVMLACAEERSIRLPVDYLLCAGMHSHPGWIGVYDCSNDSLVDSLAYPGMTGLPIVWGSPAGDFLAVGESGRPTRIWDLRTSDQVAEVVGSMALFLPAIDLLLSTNGRTTQIYRAPEFYEDTSIDLRLLVPARIPNSTQILAVRLIRAAGALVDSSDLVIFDPSTRTIVDSFTVPDGDGIGAMRVTYLNVSHDGSTAYAIGYASNNNVTAVSLTSKQVIFQTPLIGYFGTCRITPDGKELWVTDPGYPSFCEFPIWPGHVLVLNAKTGAITDTVHTFGIDPDTSVRLEVNDIQFVPGQHKAYVNCRPYCRSNCPLLVVDTETKQITKVMFADFSTSAFSIAVVPRY